MSPKLLFTHLLFALLPALSFTSCTKNTAGTSTLNPEAETIAKQAASNKGKTLTPSNSCCSDVLVSNIPGISERNRYFTSDIEVSFILHPNALDVYIIGGGIPDPYPIDSIVKSCNGKYTLSFPQGIGIPPHPDSAIIKVEPRKITFLSDFVPVSGTCNLLFDFSNNQNTPFVPSQDAGVWYVNGLAPWNQKLVINRDRTLQFESGNDSTQLDKYRIVKIEQDQPDNATLYYVTPTKSGVQPQFTQVMIKHFGSTPMVLLNLIGTPIETTPLYYLSR